MIDEMKQRAETGELLHLGQHFIPDPEMVLHPAPADDHGLGFEVANPQPAASHSASNCSADSWR